jgi:hypothetical protein
VNKNGNKAHKSRTLGSLHFHLVNIGVRRLKSTLVPLTVTHDEGEDGLAFR